MKTRQNMSSVIGALRKQHGLLAAYLEATDKIDWQMLRKPLAIAQTNKPLNSEADHLSDKPQMPEAVSPKSPFVLRRANLVRRL